MFIILLTVLYLSLVDVGLEEIFLMLTVSFVGL